MFKLQIDEGPAAGTTVELVGTMIIGREGDVAVAGDTEMSRRHTRLRVEGSRVLVEDLGSTNGTYVGGERISSPVWLDSDTELKLGLSRMTVRVAAPVPAPDVLQATALRPVDRTVVRTAQPPAPRPGGPSAHGAPRATAGEGRQARWCRLPPPGGRWPRRRSGSG